MPSKSTFTSIVERLSIVSGDPSRAEGLMRRFYLISRNVDIWEVRIGADGPVRVFGNVEAARRFAVDAARLAWVDTGNATGVKELLPDGTWEAGEQFGLDV